MNEKNKNYIVCIDSDGCAMDTMNYKHFEFFGPLAAKEWNIKNKDEFIKIWNKVNLFSLTRGCNRFIGLKLTLELYNDKFNEYTISKDFLDWVNNSKKLSNISLEETIKNSDSLDLKKALNWSIEVNKAIKEAHSKGKPFDGVTESFNTIATKTNIACISSANKEAVMHEWKTFGHLDLCQFVFTQEEGTKADCIKKLIDEHGYKNTCVLMIGDSYGDLDSAKKNNVYFYPILFDKEKQSWNEFKDIYLDKFINNEFESVQQELIDKFNFNLENGSK